MAAASWFWVLYVLCVVIGLFFGWPSAPSQPGYGHWRPFGITVIIFVLVGILGFWVFGSPIK
jgi:hypothetical protein